MHPLLWLLIAVLGLVLFCFIAINCCRNPPSNQSDESEIFKASSAIVDDTASFYSNLGCTTNSNFTSTFSKREAAKARPRFQSTVELMDSSMDIANNAPSMSSSAPGSATAKENGLRRLETLAQKRQTYKNGRLDVRNGTITESDGRVLGQVTLEDVLSSRWRLTPRTSACFEDSADSSSHRLSMSFPLSNITPTKSTTSLPNGHVENGSVSDVTTVSTSMSPSKMVLQEEDEDTVFCNSNSVDHWMTETTNNQTLLFIP